MEQRFEEHSKGEEKESNDKGAPQEESTEGEENKVETSNKQRSPWQTGTSCISRRRKARST